MKNCIILFLLFALTSCNSFDRMKYRHLKKVPATPQEFLTSEKQFALQPDSTSSEENREMCVPVISKDTTICIQHELVLSQVSAAEIREEATALPREKKSVKQSSAPIKRDWSLLIGALLIIGGLVMLSLCIFYFPSAGISFLWMIAFELAALYAAWRMIGTGVMYFITRFRRRRNFSER